MTAALTTIDSGAETLGVSVSRMYTLIREGIVPPGVYVRIGRQIRIRPDKLEEWLDAGGTALPGGWRREPEGGK